MTKPVRVVGAIPPRHSLRWRLPLLILAVIAAVVLMLLFASYRYLEATLVRAGGERAQIAADQVASLLNAEEAFAQVQAIAAHADLQRYLQTRTADAREGARTRLNTFAEATPRRVELWDNAGIRLLEIAALRTGVPGVNPAALPSGSRPAGVGVRPLQAANDLVFSDMVAEIPDGLGYLLVRSAFNINPQGIIGRLVGSDAVIKVANKAGDIWTNLSRVTPPAPVDLTRNGVAEYRAANGDARLGAVSAVPGSPWAVWVEFPRAMIVAPAPVFRDQMIAVSLIFVAIGMVLAGLLARRMTKPLVELTSAAGAIAAGDYSRRVSSERGDEIAWLGSAFNVMADEVEAAQGRLEARVVERSAELAAARFEADRASRAKSEFLSLVSHDLRTPLNAILGYAQLLEMADLPPEHQEAVRQILSGGRHLLGLIDGVLELAHIESGQLAFSAEPVSVWEVVSRAVALIEPLAAQRRIDINVVPIPPSDTVRADRQRLSQILLNLLSNAVKYNRHAGRVTVGARRLPLDRYRIVVTDTGAGIPVARLALLFQPFERLGAEQTAVEGTGLGLALSRTLAEAMGGIIGVSSVVDEGSSFWVELQEVPHHAESEATADELATPKPPGGEGGPVRATVSRPAPARGLILYIEDNLTNFGLMARIVHQRPGVELIHAPDADAAMTMVGRRRPDLVLLDLHLPGAAGEDVLRLLRADPVSRRIPIVVVTADATPGLPRRLKAAGAKACLTKPLDVREVLDLVDEMLMAHSKVDGDA